MTVRELIVALGGPGAVARELGIAVSVVSNWSKRDRIAGQQVAAVWTLAARKGIPWCPEGAHGVQLVPSEAA